MEDIGEEEVSEESAAKKQRLDVEDDEMEELEHDQMQLKKEQQLEQEMDEGDEEEEVDDGDEEEENEELTKDRWGHPHPFLLTLTHSLMWYYTPVSFLIHVDVRCLGWEILFRKGGMPIFVAFIFDI